MFFDLFLQFTAKGPERGPKAVELKLVHNCFDGRKPLKFLNPAT